MDIGFTVKVPILMLLLKFINGDEFCHDSTFNPRCADDEVLIISQAQYGRMYTGQCISDAFGYVGTQCPITDAKRDLDMYCSGKKECEVKVIDASFRGHVPCHKELKAFLDVTYHCLKVIRPSSPCDGNVPVEINEPEGYLSSHIAQETGCGTTENPLVIRSSPGQNINITLLDFSLEDISGLDHTQCRVYATIKDRRQGRPVTVCGGKRVGASQSSVLVSTGNEVELRFILSTYEQGVPSYLFHFQAIGCADPAPSMIQSMERLDSHHVRITCQSNGRETQLVCEDGVWVGHVPYCPPATHARAATEEEDGSSPLSNVLAIVLISAIAVCVSAAILCVGVLCLRRTTPATPRHALEMQHKQAMKMIEVQQSPGHQPQTKIITPDMELNTIGRGHERMRQMYALTASLHPDRHREGAVDGGVVIDSGTLEHGGGTLHRGMIPHHIYESPAELIHGAIRTDMLPPQNPNPICVLCGMNENMCVHSRQFQYTPESPVEKRTPSRATNNYSV